MDKPNAGARISFDLNQPASIEIVLKNASGDAYRLRGGDRNITYSSGHHSLLFSGLVQGYMLPDEVIPFQVIQRLVPDGDYTVVVTALTEWDEAISEGLLSVYHNEVELPALTDFVINPDFISPNQDGIDDSATITLFLPRAVQQLSVYAVSPEGDAYPIPEDEGLASPDAAGNHTYRFDALQIVGENLINGQFTVTADIFDTYEQHIRWQLPLEVQDAGDVTGYIVDGAVTYSGSVVTLNETLCFSLTVLNSGDGYMRTIGPWPSTAYLDTMNIASIEIPENKGAFRIGLDFDSSEGQYPYRWALGTPGVDLVQLENGWYLPPRHTSVVTGCVEFTEIPEINPQYAWVGLLHEQSVPQLINHRVAPYLFEVQADTR